MDTSILSAAIHFLQQAFVLNSAGWFIMCILAGTGYSLIYQMLDDHGAAILGTPILIAGAAIGQHSMRVLGLQMAHDKTVNMGIGMAGGMFVSALIIVAVLWSWGKATQR